MEIVLDIFEFDSDAYTSLWMTQNIIQKWKSTASPTNLDIKELEDILQKPQVYLFRNPRHGDIIEKAKFLAKGKLIDHQSVGDSKRQFEGNARCRPFAVVILLNPSGQHSGCRLSENDLKLLDAIKDLNEVENVSFVLLDNRHSVKYDVNDVDSICRELEEKLKKKRKTNNTFAKLYLQNDIEIRTGIGVSFNKSIVEKMNKICKKAEQIKHNINSKFRLLLEKRKDHIDDLVRKVDDLNISNYNRQEFKNEVIEISSAYLSECVERSDLSRIFTENTYNIPDTLMRHFSFRLQGTIPSTSSVRPFNDKSSSLCNKTDLCQRYKTRSHVKSIASRSMPDSVINKGEKRNIIEELYAQFLQLLTNNVQTTCESYTALKHTIVEEINKKTKMILLHELKMVSERCNKVKGFGYMNDTIHIFLKEDNDSHKEDVSAFIEQYVDLTGIKMTVKIEFRKRNITLFSALEQGSKINTSNGVTEERIHYGTLGMFLKDKNESYFFTTCAHVIGKDDLAYLPHDNSVIGKSILAIEGQHDQETQPFIDFSLIRVTPKNNLDLRLGFKTRDGQLKQGQIFRGPVFEIVDSDIYKWGASEPYLCKAKCTGIINDNQFFYLSVDKKDFAKKGDSGSIVCIGEDTDTCIAAFVIVGGDSGEEDNESYLVYKISDALDRIDDNEGEMTVCLDPSKKQFHITSNSSDHPRTSPKRKRETKVLQSRQKRK